MRDLRLVDLLIEPHQFSAQLELLNGFSVILRLKNGFIICAWNRGFALNSSQKHRIDMSLRSVAFELGTRRNGMSYT